MVCSCFILIMLASSLSKRPLNSCTMLFKSTSKLHREAKGANLLVSVQDNGHGEGIAIAIPEEAQKVPTLANTV